MVKLVFTCVFGLLAATTEAIDLESTVLFPSQTASFSGETDGGVDPRVLVEFDLSSIPRGARIRYAGLALTDNGEIPWDAPFVPVSIGAISRDWDPSSVDWTAPSSGQDWEEAGGDWNPDFSAYRVIVRDARAPARFLVTHFAQEWLDGSLPNHGIIAMMEDVADLQDIAESFNARALKPSLKIRYTIPSNDSP